MSDLDQDSKLWLLNQIYGFKSIPSNQDYETFIKAALICAKGDGVLAPEERNWVVGRAGAFRNPGYELAKTYAADEDIIDLISQASNIDKNCRRMIIYVAIQACGADGDYSSQEREKVNQIAQFLGISEDVVNQIEQFCTEEAKMREQRISLIFPEGVPY